LIESTKLEQGQVQETTAEAQRLSSQGYSMRVQTGGLELLDALAADWERICDEDPAGEAFYRPEWPQSFLRAFAPSAKLVVVSAWSGGELRAVLPLIQCRSTLTGLPVRELKGVANVHCCRLGLAHVSGAKDERLLRALWDTVKRLPGWDVLDFDYVLEDNGIDMLARCAAADHHRVSRIRAWQSLHLRFQASEGEAPWLESTRPKFRSNLRRTRRQLEGMGAVSTRHFDSADPQALDKFYALEASGWKGKQGTAIACDPRTRQFYDEVARASAKDGLLALDFLELDGKPIAAHFALQFHGRYCLAKAAYDESYQRYGPGQLLVHEVLSQSRHRGIGELDFVGPATWDESRWASGRRTHFQILIFREGWYGSVLHRVRTLARRSFKFVMRRHTDENAPLELKSQPQGSEKSSKPDL
jgi:CelD/BcsL family acetyltransferase involved in cellulose biosynthesis